MILANNEKAIEVVRSMTAEEILNKIEAASLFTYGCEALPLAEVLKNAAKTTRVVAGLDNCDVWKMLTIIAQKNPAGIIAGLEAIAKITEAKEIFLVLSENKEIEETHFELLAEKSGLSLQVEREDIIDVRVHENDLFVHLETLAAIADIITATPYGTVISVGNDQPQEVLFGTKFKEIVGDENVKSLFINERFYHADILEKAIMPDFAMGSGCIKVYTDQDCMVDVTVKLLYERVKKCCGKCTFCREGLIQFYTIFTDITRKKAKGTDLDLVLEISEAMPFSTMCSLGKYSSYVAKSLLEEFEEEVNAHLRKKVCPAGVCSAFIQIYVDPLKCEGCGNCISVCPENCIEGKTGYISMIDDMSCTKCAKCIDVCPNKAIQKTSGRLPKLPNRLTKVGRFKRI